MDYDKIDIPEGNFIMEVMLKTLIPKGVGLGLEENGCLVIENRLEETKSEKGKFRYHTIRVGDKVCKTHRYFYELYSGEEIPKGMIARHKCDNPRCVNPRHIEIGTQADNARDMVKRRRWKGKGELRQLKDNEKVVAKILLKEKSPEEVAKLLNVSKTVIFELIERS